MQHLHLNYLAVLVSALMQWFLGAIWYSPALFAKPWTAMIRVPTEGKNKRMMAGMVASFIASLMASFVLAHLIYWSDAATAMTGALVGFIAWAGFIGAPLSASYIYEGRPVRLFVINSGYWLIALLASGALLAVWR